MAGFWKRLMGRRDDAAAERSADEQYESASERQFVSEGVEGVAADEVAEQRLGGFDPRHFVDDEFKP